MAVGSFQIYKKFKERLINKEIDMDTDVFKALLLTSSHTPNLGTQNDLADISANEHAATGNYARVTLASVAFTASGNNWNWDSADIAFNAASTITAKYLVIYDDTHASDALVCYVDLDTGGGSVSSTASAFTVGTPSNIIVFS